MAAPDLQKQKIASRNRQYRGVRQGDIRESSKPRRPSMKLSLLATLSAFSVLSLTAPAQAEPADQPVATLVVVQTPAGLSRAMIDAGFEKAAPTYRQVPGLLRKYFTVNETGFGGVYLWKNRTAAEAWFSPAWRARAKATYGNEPLLTWFDSPLQIDMTGASGK